ncbi:hypothetical protein Tco_1020387 [Tanacetum coccineum]|uniref:Uncharacterized protein n=1 Tax=Tanacetum coccineum TaxID=301880 RepID=A0ABQ5G1Q9_9ASTR
MLIQHHKQKKTNLQNINNISLVISNESTDTSAALIQETTNETPKQSPEIQDKATNEDGKKRKRTETESSERTTRGSAKKQQLEKKGKEPLKKRKRVEKPKNKAEEKKKMDKKGKKKGSLVISSKKRKMKGFAPREIEMPLLLKVHPDKATLPEESSHFSYEVYQQCYLLFFLILTWEADLDLKRSVTIIQKEKDWTKEDGDDSPRMGF